MIKEAVPLFVKITDKFCDRCKSNGLKIITNGNKSKPVYIGYKCQKCGCDGNWQDGIISLEIDHINGDC